MDSKVIKFLGLIATAVGFAATLVSNWVGDKKMEETVNKKVNEAFAKRNEESEELSQDVIDNPEYGEVYYTNDEESN